MALAALRLGVLVLPCAWAALRGSAAGNQTRRLAIRPSTVPYCPVGYKDCGTCRCVPEPTCAWCPGGLREPVPEPIESTVPGCPHNFVDCGDCLCVPTSTCQWCGMGLGEGDDNVTVPGHGHNISMQPSRVPYCPEGYVDCGTCLCVAEVTCQWCPDAYRPTLALPGPSDNVTMRPSAVYGCPNSYVDCGTCLCVPPSTCRWCPGAAVPAEDRVIASRPSEVPFCPQGYVDCGTCLCVPETTCQWCPGAIVGPNTSTLAPTLAPGETTTTLSGETTTVDEGETTTVAETTSLALTTTPSSGGIISRPSEVPYCPIHFVDCGTCLCVPLSSCRWCPGAWSPSHPSTPGEGSNARPSTVPGCPAAYVDCGTCLCVPESTCRWCPGGGAGGGGGGGSSTPAPTPGGGVTRPSTILGCPRAYVDCGTCLCVPESTCRWCPGSGGSLPAPAPAPPVHHGGITRPSTILGCPRSYVDCGTCLCVPESTCRWCPGGGGVSPTPAPAPPQPGHGGITRPSTILGCPHSFVDCGTCLCVPESTCRWCPGGGGARPPAHRPEPGSGARPSRIIGCPRTYVDCGTCLCVPASTCQWCPGASFLSLPSNSLMGEQIEGGVVLLGGLTSSRGMIDTRPSSIIGCPHGFVDCGSCMCVPRRTCGRWCTASEPGVTLPVPGRNFTARPSEVPYCPRRFVDCGGCSCVPRSICRWCPDDSALPGPVEENATTNASDIPVPSQIPGCPQGYVDCGACMCVPESTCQWCPEESHPPLVPVVPQTNITMHPSVIPFCPPNFKDCGSCFCVPENTCQWCPGAGAAPQLPPPNVSKQPSEVPGCPADFWDCGPCRCVPEDTCQYCPGWGPPVDPTTTSVVTTTESSAPPTTVFASTTLSTESTSASTTAAITTAATTPPPAITTTAAMPIATSSEPVTTTAACEDGYTFCEGEGCLLGTSCDEYGYSWR